MIESPSSRSITGADPRSIANAHRNGWVQVRSAALANWDALLRIVMANLTLSVGELRERISAEEGIAQWRRIRADVINGVSALEHIHEAMRAENERHFQFRERTDEAQLRFREVCVSLDDPAVASRVSSGNPALCRPMLLPNSDCIRELLVRELSVIGRLHKVALAVVHVNLGDFRAFVACHGRDVGDQFLNKIATRLLLAIRCQDVLCQDADGEFTCLVRGIAQVDALGVFAHKLLATVLAPVRLGPLSLAVRPGIGIAVYPSGGMRADDLLLNAKSALQTARRNRFAFAFADEQ